MSKIFFISCVSMKLEKKAAAKDLYISPLFKMNYAYAKMLKAPRIYILSAKYGLTEIEQVISPYNQTLNTMKVDEIKAWAKRVEEQMKGKINLEKDEAVFLAGERYRKYLMPLFKKSEAPLKGLGIGRQLQFLKRKLENK